MEKYELKEITPENILCVLGGCPAIYKIKKLK